MRLAATARLLGGSGYKAKPAEPAGPSKVATWWQARQKLRAVSYAQKAPLLAPATTDAEPIWKRVTDKARKSPRTFGALFLLKVAASCIIFAEAARATREAFFREIRSKARAAGCSAEPLNDLELVHLACPMVEVHDFSREVAGTFVQHVAAGIDLRGLSIELRSELYQWTEVVDCGRCRGQRTDKSGHCEVPSPTATCIYSFRKRWVSKPISPSTFHCKREGQADCMYPPGGLAEVQNVGVIPDSLRSFKRVAPSGSITIGDFPARFHLDADLIAQIPSSLSPLFFKPEALPKLPGKVTTLMGTSLENELRLEANPGSPDPSIGDLRATIVKSGFYDRDVPAVSVVAKQLPWIQGARHRLLGSWSPTDDVPSWASPWVPVRWLNMGARSLDSMVQERKDEAANEILLRTMALRCFGFALATAALSLLAEPKLREVLSSREQGASLVDAGIAMLALGCAIVAYVLLFASLPWLHHLPGWGFLLLGCAISSLIIGLVLLLRFGIPQRWLPRRSQQDNDCGDGEGSRRASTSGSQEEEVKPLVVETGGEPAYGAAGEQQRGSGSGASTAPKSERSDDEEAPEPVEEKPLSLSQLQQAPVYGYHTERRSGSELSTPRFSEASA